MGGGGECRIRNKKVKIRKWILEMKWVFSHEWANPIPLHAGRQATPLLNEKGAIGSIDYLCETSERSPSRR